MNTNDCLEIMNNWDKDTVMWLQQDLSNPIKCSPDDDEYIKLTLLETMHYLIKKKQHATQNDIVKMNFSDEKIIQNVNTLQNKILNNTSAIPIYEEIVTIDSAIKFLNNIDNESYDWLKIQYRDVCSGGDVVINKLLDTFLTNNTKTLVWDDILKLLEGYTEDKLLYYIDHIFQFHKDYLEGKNPDPWWAD